VISAEQAKTLLENARLASHRAYAPYSKFHVGAAVLSASGDIFCGANVENQSYGLTCCAERVALFSAVSQGHRDFLAIAVWGDSCPDGEITPCGACRQVMAEWMAPTSEILINTAAGVERLTLEALLPRGFSLK
jgi:cytidine deaminase